MSSCESKFRNEPVGNVTLFIYPFVSEVEQELPAFVMPLQHRPSLCLCPCRWCGASSRLHTSRIAMFIERCACQLRVGCHTNRVVTACVSSNMSPVALWLLGCSYRGSQLCFFPYLYSGLGFKLLATQASRTSGLSSIFANYYY